MIRLIPWPTDDDADDEDDYCEDDDAPDWDDELFLPPTCCEQCSAYYGDALEDPPCAECGKYRRG